MFEGMEKLGANAAKQDALVTVLHTLALEYQDKAITTERFAYRCFEEIAKYCKSPSEGPRDA